MGQYHFVLQNDDLAGDVKDRRSHSGISVWVKNSDEKFGHTVQMLTWKQFVQLFSWKICLVQGQRSNYEFRETKLE